MAEKRITVLFITTYTVGTIGHLIPTILPLMLLMTPFILFGLGLVLLASILKEKRLTFWLWCIGIYVITFLLEVIGVATGVIFGPYTYGTSLGPKLWGVPLVIGFNWLLVIMGAISFTSRYLKKSVLFMITVGILTILFDYLMEPVALRLDYWQWHTEGVPLRNYLAWFLISVVSTGCYSILRLDLQSRLAYRYVLIQMAFFVVLRILLL